MAFLSSVITLWICFASVVIGDALNKKIGGLATTTVSF
jgi:hypothetical protein